ncbi:germ cell nuclear acidic protein-like [Uloborus diversus]|uniref:germ cell nuclear acidic protein-like n=1 Tax=Uloborus diversus TaxID=327109 RepID=UPI00240965F2|nr:germ cell nuclear acidic protein-like [Uloborus diversus]
MWQNFFTFPEGAFTLCTPSNRNRSMKCKSTSEEGFSFLFKENLETERNFTKNREKLSEYCFEYFNKKVFDDQIPKDTGVKWSDYLRTTAGKTFCRRKENVYSCEILLSTKVLTSFDRLRDTLLHEMCHAAVWTINKQHQVSHHGPLWQIWAARCKLILPEIDVPQRCHNYEISYPFLYKCESCTWKCGRYQKSKKLNNALCPYCKKKIVLKKNLVQ